MEYPLLPVTPLQTPYTPFSIRSQKGTPQTVYSKGLREKHVEDGDLDAHLHGFCDLPSSWKEYKHLDGRSYFFHETFKIVTYDSMRDPDTRNEIENIYQSLQHLSKCVGIIITEEQEFYIGLYPRGYYCVDYEFDQVFWLQNVALSMLAPHCSAKDRMRVSFESILMHNYYRHIAQFPNHRTREEPERPRDLIRIQEALTRNCSEFVENWCRRDAELYREVKDMAFSSEEQSPHLTWWIASLLEQEYGSRVINQFNSIQGAIYAPSLIKAPRAWVSIKLQAVFFHLRRGFTSCLSKANDTFLAIVHKIRTIFGIIFEDWLENLFVVGYLSSSMAFLVFYNLQPYTDVNPNFAIGGSLGVLAAGLHHIGKYPFKREASQFQSNAASYLESGGKSAQLFIFVLNIPAIFLRWQLFNLSGSLIMFTFALSSECRTCVVSPITFCYVVGSVFVTLGVLRGVLSLRV